MMMMMLRIMLMRRTKRMMTPIASNISTFVYISHSEQNIRTYISQRTVSLCLAQVTSVDYIMENQGTKLEYIVYIKPPTKPLQVSRWIFKSFQRCSGEQQNDNNTYTDGINMWQGFNSKMKQDPEQNIEVTCLMNMNIFDKFTSSTVMKLHRDPVHQTRICKNFKTNTYTCAALPV